MDVGRGPRGSAEEGEAAVCVCFFRLLQIVRSFLPASNSPLTALSTHKERKQEVIHMGRLSSVQ